MYQKSIQTEGRAMTASSVLLRKVYIWMTLALIITGCTSAYIGMSPGLMSVMFQSQAIFWGVIIAELAVVFYLSARINKMSFTAATVCFILYSVLNGVTLTPLLFAFTQASIAKTFFITAGTFGATAIYGSVTKRDLSSIGSFCFMGLIGLIIASVVNIFWGNSVMDAIISYVGVAIFVGLTVYDSQKIKQMMNKYGNEINDMTQKIALMGALTLYLDFINMFIYLLRIFGDRK